MTGPDDRPQGKFGPIDQPSPRSDVTVHAFDDGAIVIARDEPRRPSAAVRSAMTLAAVLGASTNIPEHLELVTRPWVGNYKPREAIRFEPSNRQKQDRAGKRKKRRGW